METNIELARKYFTFETSKKVKTIEPLKGGFFDNVFLINDAYVIKLDKPIKDPFYDKTDHLLIMTMLNTFKWMEKPLCLDPAKPYALYKVIHQAFMYNDTMTDEQLQTATNVIKKLHKVEAPDFLPEFDPFERITFYKSKSKNTLDGRYERKIFRLANELYEKKKRCICHNDLVKGNMLFGFSNTYLIDFEFSALNIPEFDLASLISENPLTEENKQLVLKTYYGSKLNKIKTKHVNIMIALLNVLWFYWANFMFNETKNEAFLEIAEAKRKQVEKDQEII